MKMTQEASTPRRHAAASNVKRWPWLVMLLLVALMPPGSGWAASSGPLAQAALLAQLNDSCPESKLAPHAPGAAATPDADEQNSTAPKSGEALRFLVSDEVQGLALSAYTGAGRSIFARLAFRAQQDLTDLSFLVSPLYRTPGYDAKIDEPTLVETPTSITAGDYSSICFEIPAPPGPGIFVGEITASGARSDATTASATIPITLTTTAPNATLFPNGLNLKLVDCLNSIGLAQNLDCWLSETLFGKPVVPRDSKINFSNPSPMPFEVSSVGTVVNSLDTSSAVESPFSIGVAPNLTLDPGKSQDFELTVMDENLTPGHYTGSITFNYLFGEPKQLGIVSIPVDFYVRGGPLLAIIFVIAGIVLGRMVKRWNEYWGEQWVGYSDLRRIEESLSDTDRFALEPSLVEAKQANHRGAFDERRAIVQTIASRLPMLQTLDEAEGLASECSEDQAKNVRAWVERARNLIRNDADETAKSLVNDLQKASIQCSISKDAGEAEEINRILSGSPPAKALPGNGSGSEGNGHVSSSRPNKWNLPWPDFNHSVPLHLTAVSYVVQFVSFVFLIGFGVYTLYYNSSLTFGASRLVDYVPLVLWGFSADAASRTIGSIASMASASRASSGFMGTKVA